MIAPRSPPAGWRRGAVAVCAAACPGLALAHLNSTGMGPVYDGVLHFLLSPEDLVPALSLALLAGLRDASQGRKALFVLPAAWLAGGVLGSSLAATSGSPFVSAAWFLLLGGLVAADARLPATATVSLAGVVGLYHGGLNGSGMGGRGVAFAALLGLSSAVFVLVALASALVVSLRARWARIAVRVAGSWVAAAGILMVGWAMRVRAR